MTTEGGVYPFYVFPFDPCQMGTWVYPTECSMVIGITWNPWLNQKHHNLLNVCEVYCGWQPMTAAALPKPSRVGKMLADAYLVPFSTRRTSAGQPQLSGHQSTGSHLYTGSLWWSPAVLQHPDQTTWAKLEFWGTAERTTIQVSLRTVQDCTQSGDAGSLDQWVQQKYHLSLKCNIIFSSNHPKVLKWTGEINFDHVTLIYPFSHLCVVSIR